MKKSLIKNRPYLVSLLLPPLVAAGCANRRKDAKLTSPYPRQVTVAIAPVFNYSGASKLDMLKVTDILFSELQQVDGFSVIPVNRTLAQMQKEGINRITDAQQALSLARSLGADMIIISAITEYNPYYPPIVGVAMQLFGVQGDTKQNNNIDPVAMARAASPLKFNAGVDPKYWPKNQIQEIFNSRDKDILSEVRSFAKQRGTGDSPYKWELYLHSQEYYLRFVWYQTIHNLLDKEIERINETYLSDVSNEKEFN